MRNETHLTVLQKSAAIVAAFLFVASSANAQISGATDTNSAKMADYQNECAIAKNPSNKLQLFAACNNANGGLFAARSTDGGATWVYPDPSKTIANGINPALGPAACCDPTLAWDTFGNLFITYIDAGVTNIVTILSTDGGATFTNLASFGPASVDQPTVAAGAGAVWIVWNQSGSMVARGAAVTGPGPGGIGAFGPLQAIPGTGGCSFGDLAIAPSGAVVQACESPSGGSGPAQILVNTKGDGLGPNPFGAAVVATSTNVGGFHFIPAQNVRSIDAEAGFAFDNNATSPHFGRLYLIYTDETAFPDTDIQLRFSDNNGGTWSNPSIRVNGDASGRSQFLPRIASNPTTGNIAVCWHDARNSATNTTMQEFCTIATPTGASPTFMADTQIGDGVSTGTGSNPPAPGQADIQFGDYSGLTYSDGLVHPIWADNSNSTGDNPNGTGRYDAYSDVVKTSAPRIEVPGPVAFGIICAGAVGHETLMACNTGDANLIVSGITSSNGQFAVTTPSAGYPIVIIPGGCFPFDVTFTPAASGPQTATLTIASNDPTNSALPVAATAQSEAGALGLSPDLRFDPTVIQSVGSCHSSRPFVISNTGTCNLTITNVSIGGANAGDYSLSGLPAFPITLQPGHQVGSGDLDVLFGPNALARERTANITVTFVSNPATGTTSTQTRLMCGESVRTGARVLVTEGGVPMAQVHEIELKRLWGFLGLKKEIDEVKNVPLQTVTPTPGTACGGFQFHREWGGASNPDQLPPGIYQLKVEAKIAGHEVRKKVYFSVDTCGFNGTIVVDF